MITPYSGDLGFTFVFKNRRFDRSRSNFILDEIEKISEVAKKIMKNKEIRELVYELKEKADKI